MSLQLIGTLPVSALNIGVVAGIPVLNAQITKLQADISDLTASIATQLQVGLNIPNIASLTVALAAQLTSLPSLLIPSNILVAGADFNTDLVAQLGIIQATLALATAVTAQFEAGISAGNLTLWTYTGPASGMGEAFSSIAYWSGVSSLEQISGFVLATESLASWSAFGDTFNTGSSANRVANSTDKVLRQEGIFNGGQLNTGVLTLTAPIDLFIAELEALAANISAQIQVSLGLNLPSISALTASLNAVTPDLLLSNLLTVRTNLTAEIGAITVSIDGLLALIADLNASLSAGGLAMWSYAGAAGDFGSELKSAMQNGLPNANGAGAPIYGLIVATRTPTSMVSFGNIFKVA